MRRPFMLWPLIFILLFLALGGGLYGGITMLIDPTGNRLGVADALPLLPVTNFILPGIFLIVVMGLFPLLLTYGLIARPNWPWSVYKLTLLYRYSVSIGNKLYN